MIKHLLLPLILTVTTGCSVISSQLPDAEPPPLPSWGSLSEQWDPTGLTISTYASAPYNFNNYSQNVDVGHSGELHNQLELAEEAAIRRARGLILNELTSIWLDYINHSEQLQSHAAHISEQIDTHLRGILVNRRFYDAQRRIFHVQVYIPRNRIVSVLEKTFKTKVDLENRGKIMTASNPYPI